MCCVLEDPLVFDQIFPQERRGAPQQSQHGIVTMVPSMSLPAGQSFGQVALHHLTDVLYGHVGELLRSALDLTWLRTDVVSSFSDILVGLIVSPRSSQRGVASVEPGRP